ncbi:MULTISPECIES: outer membrane protein assembly factor BamE [Giesbergeria]|uniref:Outer membrane protein assembly factor BamE n=1 Tax=Giesbergeria sinuosa TaxID=80883 RepID=A0ABV9QET4_9BURK
MPVQVHCSARLGLILLWGASLAACGSLDGTGERLASVVTPYRVDVVQGNFVSREQVEALQPGMGRQQVRDILGTPLVTSLFHADRWEYVFTLRRPGVEAQTRKLTVFFKEDTLLRFEGDEMPSESEFVATLGNRKKAPEVPVLEATPEQLARYPARPKADTAVPAAPARTSYPPLETPER